MWPGSDYPYSDHVCTFNIPYNESYGWNDRVDFAMSWFTDEKTPTNLVMMYFEEPDFHAHIYGPESEVVIIEMKLKIRPEIVSMFFFLAKITKTVAKLDDLTKYIQEQLIAHNLDKRINVIHLSDHGMNSVSPPNFIDLRKFTTKKAFKWYGSSPILQIVPKDDGSKMSNIHFTKETL